MIASGAYLAQVDILKMFTKKSLFWISIARLLLIPALVMILFSCIKNSSFYELKMSIFIAAACPVGSNIAVYAQIHNKDY